MAFALYAIFAPHSIAGAEIALGLAGVGWILRTILTRRTGIRRTPLDLPLWLFFAWTVISALLSAEPRISLAKIQSVCVFLLFYLTQAIVTRRSAVILAALMIASGVAGSLWSLFDIARGRGVVVEAVASDSTFRAGRLEAGDAIWRIGGSRVASVQEVDDAIRKVPAGTRLPASIISHGEHVEWPGFYVTDELKMRASPSGLTGSERTHRFRASGWTRHYESFSEIIQMLAQLALGFALANLRRGPRSWRVHAALAANALLTAGIVLTAMRTVLVAFVIGACFIAWRAAQGRARLLVLAVIVAALACGSLAVWQIRARGALELQDASASLRLRVARIGLSRIRLHPIFGHGMDAMHNHWAEWGFPGTDMLHMHSTPLQLAFDRGLPAMLLWLWVVGAFWLMAARAEKAARDSPDANRHGLLLGATGALAGFFASSLVNYNFGAGLVALAFWWLVGTVVALTRDDPHSGPE